MSDLNSIYKDAEQKMQRCIDGLIKELTKIRTDRAQPSLLEGILVEYYGQRTSLARVANIVVEDAKTLTITPFDKSNMSAIEKAIIAANLGFNPVVVGSVIKISIPQLTEERRKALVKQVKLDVENARISVRNVRREANMQIKALSTSKVISLNDKEAAENKIQKLTDSQIDKIDKIGSNKESDLMKF
jgi:ribosome recycling factor